MQQLANKKLTVFFSALLLSVFVSIAGIMYYVNAADSPASKTATAAVEITNIDYDDMQVTINMNGNIILYYSTNKTKWYEADGAIDSGSMKFDISWISAASDTKLYFRGNEITTTENITIPKYNKSFKVTFDKVTGEFDFQNTEGAKTVRWRKQTDYTWHYVNLNTTGTTKNDGLTKDTAQSPLDLRDIVENMRVKGTKLIFQIAGENGTDRTKVGSLPSKEVKVSIPAKKAAPNVKVNVKKLTVNTTTRMEYSKDQSTWTSCSRNMTLEELAKDAVDGKSDVKLYFRTEATNSAPASKVATVVVPKRETAPSSALVVTQTPGDTAGKGKATLSFDNVPTTGYEYIVVKPGVTFDPTKASWRTIKVRKDVKFTEKTLPANSKVYVRIAGVAENVNKGISLQLPSQHYEKTIAAYTAPSSGTTTPSTGTTTPAN